ncbi:DNA-binding protein [Marinilabiliaceae bacterium JC017]|nr:DNA-binding protein [Marinilabiliaceae bacterium JC017]
MSTTITFNQLRKLKDNLPEGSIRTIAEELSLDVETVRNYFGGSNYDRGKCVGIHVEQGPDGGIVELDDTTILEMAREIIEGKREIHYKS